MMASHRRASKLLRRLAASDLAARLKFRFKAYLATAFAAWSLTLLFSLFIVDSRYGGSSRFFHITIMAALGSLPVFMTYPFPASAGMDVVRRADLAASIESWLAYPGGPAERLLEIRANEALVISAKDASLLWKATQRQKLTIMGIAAFGILCLVIAQSISFKTGRGLSFSYPEPLATTIEVERKGLPLDTASSSIVPDTLDADERNAPGARTYKRTGSASEDALAEPDFVAIGMAQGGSAHNGEASSDARGNASQNPHGTGSERGQKRSGSTSIGERSKGESLQDGFSEEGNASGTAGSPGWEGSGGALDASPLVDYTARFERLFTEASGKEAVLGEAPSAETVSAAITQYYASFDTRVLINTMLDPTLAKLEESWRKAFIAEDKR